jgi:predicted ATPase
MIDSIHIKNFKSVVDLSLDLGAFNVLIGENGCGKSNILEAISFGAAASADKLDYEFLGSRGIRITNPEFMFSAFSNSKKKKSIVLNFKTVEKEFRFELFNENSNPKKWVNRNKEIALKKIERIFNAVYLEEDENNKEKVLSQFSHGKEEISSISDILKQFRNEPELTEIFGKLFPTIVDREFTNPEISGFIIFSPEQSSLRRFEETTQIYPLGIKGEGLFQYLKEIAFDKKNKKILNNIKQNLILLDWYESFDIPENLMQNEFAIKIKDKYLNQDLQFFDQRSTNEGFLYLLFYSTLFISKSTPAFFAIDNIDASLNPKLCMQLTRNLSALAKKHKKQVILTTQNPAILDGLDLEDNDQRLFVVRRNDEGHTKAKRIEYKTDRTLKLSEVWTNGFIGGLPENF